MNHMKFFNVRSINTRLSYDQNMNAIHSAIDMYFNNNTTINNITLGQYEGEEIKYEISKTKYNELGIIKPFVRTYNDIVS